MLTRKGRKNIVTAPHLTVFIEKISRTYAENNAIWYAPSPILHGIVLN